MSASIEAKNLTYHYADGTEALKDVSFRIESGACAALVGPNGAGKSTLLLHLNGLLPDASDAKGAVLINEVAITKKNAMAVRRQVGLLFQDPDDQLFCPTVFDDVAFGPQQLGLSASNVKARVEKALGEVGLSGFEKRSPHRLSGGEKRRVCLAGILACEPEVLVLDEPTAGLDPRARREFMQLLKELSATKIIATHDLEMVVELCSRCVLIDGGRVICEGETIGILSDEKLMVAHGLEKPHSLKNSEAVLRC